MSLLIAAIFVASVLGSFHCVGMCGAFLAIATGGPQTGWRRQAALQSAYHLGRLTTYVLLGAAAGAAGGLVNLAGTLAGIRPVAAMLAGAAMIVFGVVTLLRSTGVQIGRFHLPGAWTRLMQRGHRAAMDRPPIARSALIGLLTTLLPCGWLYAFAVTAAGTASPLRGAIAMAAFWAGTLPALVALGAGLRRLLGPIGRKLPGITAVALVAAGLYTLTGRMLIDPLALTARADAGQVKQVHSAKTVSVPEPDSAPCCKPHDHRH